MILGCRHFTRLCNALRKSPMRPDDQCPPAVAIHRDAPQSSRETMQAPAGGQFLSFRGFVSALCDQGQSMDHGEHGLR